MFPCLKHHAYLSMTTVYSTNYMINYISLVELEARLELLMYHDT